MADNYSGANIATRQGEGEANVMQWGNTDRAINQLYQEQKTREARGYNDYLQGQQALQKEFANVRAADMPDVIKGYNDLKQTKQQMLFDNNIRNNPLLLAQKKQEANIKEAQLRQLIAGSSQMKEDDKYINQRGLVNPSEFEISDDPNKPRGLALHAQHMTLPYNQRVAQGLVGATPYLYQGADLPKLEAARKMAIGTPTLVPTGETQPVDANGEVVNNLQVLRSNKPSTVAAQLTNSFATNKGEHGASYLVNKLDPSIIKSYTDKFDAIDPAKYQTLWGEPKQALLDRIASAKTDAERYSNFSALQHAVDDLPTYGKPEPITNKAVTRSLNDAEWAKRNKITNQQAIGHILLNKSVTANDPMDFINKTPNVLKTGDATLINNHLASWGVNNKKDAAGNDIGFINAETLPDKKVKINYTTEMSAGKGLRVAVPQSLVIDPSNNDEAIRKIANLNTQFTGKQPKVIKGLQNNPPSGNESIKVKLPSGQMGTIPKSKWNDFQKENKGAVIVGEDGITINKKVTNDNWKVTKDIDGKSHAQGGVDIDVNGKKVNAEDDELKIKNDDGHEAIIPKTLRQRVLAFLKIGDKKSVSKLVDGLPKDPSVAADGGSYSDDDKNKISPPENYKPLSVPQRAEWNSFLDYLHSKGVAGSKDLDVKDKSLGLSYLAQYQKENPKTTITPDMIQNVQYEQQQLRKGDKFGSFTPDELKEWQAKNKDITSKEVSPVDNWLGSITSKLYYPQGSQVFTNSEGKEIKPKKDFGTDIESYYRATKTNDLVAKK